MRELIWLDGTVNDLVRLRKFIAKENLDAAKRAVLAIKEAAKNLLSHPQIGKPVEDLAEYRDLMIRFGAAGYLMRYRVHHNAVYVVHVRHYREDGFKIKGAA